MAIRGNRGFGWWTRRLLFVPVALVALYAAVLLFPSPFFEHHRSFGQYRVYANKPIGAGFEAVVLDLDRRVRAMEHPPSHVTQRIYLCGPRAYRWFARLTRKTPDSLAIGLGVARETFVSMDRVRLFAERNRGRIRHSRFEGNLAEVIAHEIAHFHSIRALGYRAHLAQPMWKSEGWAEYQANLAAIHADPDYDLRSRIDVLLDPASFGGRYGVARRLWESQLLVEYLGEVEGFALADLVRDEITEAGARDRMMAWHRSSATPGGYTGRDPEAMP